MERFEFVFQGTYEQFDFFRFIAGKKVFGSGLSLDNYIGEEHHCSMLSDPAMIFKMGMVVSACYNKFGHLTETQFSNS